MLTKMLPKVPQNVSSFNCTELNISWGSLHHCPKRSDCEKVGQKRGNVKQTAVERRSDMGENEGVPGRLRDKVGVGGREVGESA